MAFPYACHTVDWGSESEHSLMALLSLFLNSYAALPRYTRGGIQLSAGFLRFPAIKYRSEVWFFLLHRIFLLVAVFNRVQKMAPRCFRMTVSSFHKENSSPTQSLALLRFKRCPRQFDHFLSGDYVVIVFHGLSSACRL